MIFLHKIGIKQSYSCTFSGEATENLVHLFWSCNYYNTFRKDCYQWIIQNTSKVETQARFTCMSYFDCFSVTVSAIYCLNPNFRLCFVRNWVLLYIHENENRSAQLIRSDNFTFLCLSFRHLVQNNQIVKVLRISTHQTLLRGKTRRFQGFFMVS